MRHFALTALAAVLASSGPVFAGSAADDSTSAAEAANLEDTQPQAGPGTDVGEQTEPTIDKVGQETGAEGKPASLVTEDETIEKESDIQGAKSEEMMEKSDTATIN